VGFFFSFFLEIFDDYRLSSNPSSPPWRILFVKYTAGLSVEPQPAFCGGGLTLELEVAKFYSSLEVELKQRKLQLNPRKNFFPLRVTEPWNRLPREVVESPSLEIFQTRLDKVL